MNLHQRLRTLWDDLRATLWFRPAVGVLLALALALFTALLDEAASKPLIPYFRIGISGAQAVLAALAAATLTVVGLIFSILMVVLVLASQQFSPRILRNVIRDRAAQDVLSIFIGAFTYSLLMLALINEERAELSAPVFSVTTAIGLALVAEIHPNGNARLNFFAPFSTIRVGRNVSRWMPRSSKPVAGGAEPAAVGSTPTPSRHLAWW
jgi:uncharacterized membrane protein